MERLLDRRLLLAIWAAIFLIKFALGIVHLTSVRKRIAQVKLDMSPDAYHGTNPETRRALDEFALSINETFDSYQRRTQREHLIAAGGYLVAALTSLLSFMAVLRGIIWGKGIPVPLAKSIEI